MSNRRERTRDLRYITAWFPASLKRWSIPFALGLVLLQIMVVPRGSHAGAPLWHALAPELQQTTQCGAERWGVKTGGDPDAGKVNLTSPQPTTIQSLLGVAAPSVLPPLNRIPPVETTYWSLDATLIAYKFETDSDYHLVLRDAAGKTMISEIPLPACVNPASPFLPQITQARHDFDAHFTPGPCFLNVSVPVHITGVGFFDFVHGQFGVAPNGVEIHPVLSVQFLGPTGVPGSATCVPEPAALPTISRIRVLHKVKGKFKATRSIRDNETFKISMQWSTSADGAHTDPATSFGIITNNRNVRYQHAFTYKPGKSPNDAASYGGTFELTVKARGKKWDGTMKAFVTIVHGANVTKGVTFTVLPAH